MRKRLISLLLAFVMVVTLIPVQTFAFSTKDVAEHWSSAAIEKCYNYGIMLGYEGNFRPSDPITRAEFASLINNAFNYTSTEGAVQFADVSENSWYYKVLQIASAEGYFKGTGNGNASPNSNIKREDAFCVLGRIMALSTEDETTDFVDDANISNYARKEVVGMTNAGYLKGSDGKLNPKANLSRGEAAQILSTIFGEIADENTSGGTYQNLTIRKAGVTLDGVTVNGDLFITSGVGLGDVTLNNTTVNGRFLVSGGNTNSITVTDSKLDSLLVNSRFNTHIEFKNTVTNAITLSSSSSLSIGSANIVYDSETGVMEIGGNTSKLAINGTQLGITSNGVENILNTANATSIKLLEDAVVKELVLSSPTVIDGKGKIEKLVIHSDGLVIGEGIVDINDIVVDKGVNITIGGVKYVGDGIKIIKAEDTTKPIKDSNNNNNNNNDSDPVGTKFIVSAKFNGLTNITVEAKKSLSSLTTDNIIIKKSNGTAINKNSILNIKISENNPNIAIITLDRLAFDNDYSTKTLYDESEKYSEGATIEFVDYNAGTNYDYTKVEIKKNGNDYSEYKEIMTSESGGGSWFNLVPAVDLGQKLDDNSLNGQIGTIKATMIVIDDPNSKAEDNDGKSDSGKDKGNRTPDGKILKTAQDYYDYFAPAASDFLRESSYGLVDIDVKLVECSENNGVYRLSGDNASTYPAARGGNVDTYLLEALNLAKNDLKDKADNRNVLYVVAAENFDEISYGPTDVHGGKLSEIGLNGYGALVRIGQDSYSSFKKKAFIHELGHDLGLPDLYTEGDTSQRDAFSGSIDGYPGIGHWGMMSNINSPSHDFLGYEKWQFGWIRNDQVDIITKEGKTTHELTASSVKGGTKLISIPGNTKGVTYIVEYKRAAGVEVPPYKEASKPAFENEGILIYKIDANNQSMQSPITVVNLQQTDPLAEPTEAAYKALNRSVLGPKSGVYSYEDKAAGIVISVDPTAALPADVNAPYTVNVTKTTPKVEERKPVLSDAHFLDFTTIECLTNYDLRGIKASSVKVLKDGKTLTGVKINRVVPGVLRVTIGSNQINSVEDMKNVEIYTNEFSFFKESDKSTVGPAKFSDDLISLSDAKFEAFDKITLTSQVDLSSCKSSDYSIAKKNGTVIPYSAYTVSYNNEGKKVTINLTDKSYFLTTSSTEGVTVKTNPLTNFDPSTATAKQMRYGEANGILLTPASELVAVDKFVKGIADVSIIGEVVKPKYAVGDVMNFSLVDIKITYADSSIIETALSAEYLDKENSDANTELGNNKKAVFKYDDKTVTIDFDVVEHPMNLSNKFYGIEIYNADKQIEYWSYKDGYISTWGKYATTINSNGALFIRPTSWTGDTNKNLYEIYKDSSVLIGTDDSFIKQFKVAECEVANNKATSWQIMNLADGTYAIINADKNKAFAYLGEETGNPLTITDFDPNNIKDTQRFILKAYKAYSPDYKELNNEIKNAETELSSTVISTDGSDVFIYKNWVTQSVANALSAEVIKAKDIVSKDSAESSEKVSAAVSELKTKISFFKDAKKPGLIDKRDYSALETVIADAEKVRNNVVVDTDGLNCSFDKLWVTQETSDNYNDSIDFYHNIVDNDLGKGNENVEEYILQHVADLKDKVSKFNDSKQPSKKAVSSVEFVNGAPGEIIYGVGDIFDIYNLQVAILETSTSTAIKVNLSSYYKISTDDETKSLGDKTAVFEFGGVKVEVPYKVVAHPMYSGNSFYYIYSKAQPNYRLEGYSIDWKNLSIYQGAGSPESSSSWNLIVDDTGDKNCYMLRSGTGYNYAMIDDESGKVAINNSNEINEGGREFWKIVNLGNDFYAIVNKVTGKAITYPGGTTSGTLVKTSDFDINDVKEDQMFKFDKKTK